MGRSPTHQHPPTAQNKWNIWRKNITNVLNKHQNPYYFCLFSQPQIFFGFVCSTRYQFFFIIAVRRRVVGNLIWRFVFFFHLSIDFNWDGYKNTHLNFVDLFFFCFHWSDSFSAYLNEADNDDNQWKSKKPMKILDQIELFTQTNDTISIFVCTLHSTKKK